VAGSVEPAETVKLLVAQLVEQSAQLTGWCHQHSKSASVQKLELACPVGSHRSSAVQNRVRGGTLSQPAPPWYAGVA